MIAQWMLHAIVVTALLGLAAVAAERLLRLWRREARMVWCAAMVASVVLPVLSLAQAYGLVPHFAGVETVQSQVAVLLPPIVVTANRGAMDAIVATCWLIATAVLAFRIIGISRGLAARRRTWRAAVVDGEQVFVSRDAGPAVVGFRSPTIVVPEWVLELDASLRTLVLEHEREHRDRGDPRLLVAALAVAVAMPWNVGLWYLLARLRGAMELDCDLRVLRAYPDARRYGSLLLAVAQRADRGGLLAPALTESNSLLGRRIMAMRSPVARRRLTLSLTLGAGATILTIVACEVQAPSESTAAPVLPSAQVAAAPGPIVVPAGHVYQDFQVEQPARPEAASVSPRYPDALRKAGVEGDVLVQFVVRPDGRADVASLKILKQSDELFGSAVRAALPMMRFKPAMVGDRAVSQLVQSPFTFSLSR